MKKILIISSIIVSYLLFSSNAFAQFVVFDPITEYFTKSIYGTSNSILEKDTEISMNTKNILDTNKQILDTVKKSWRQLLGIANKILQRKPQLALRRINTLPT